MLFRSLLRPGDILTHAYSGSGNNTVRDGKVAAAALEAKRRGVVIDVGHGGGSFDYTIAEAAIQQGAPPDTISSDIHQLCIDGPAYDQVTTLSKFLCMGMELSDVIAASTVNAAMALRRPELGSLKQIGRAHV